MTAALEAAARELSDIIRDNGDGTTWEHDLRRFHAKHFGPDGTLAAALTPPPDAEGAWRDGVEAAYGLLLYAPQDVCADCLNGEHGCQRTPTCLQRGDNHDRAMALLAAALAPRPSPAVPALHGLSPLDALNKWGRHFETCPGSHPAYCECGLTAYTDALRALAHPPSPPPVGAVERIKGDLLERLGFLLNVLPDSAAMARAQIIACQGVVADYFNMSEPREPWGPAS